MISTLLRPDNARFARFAIRRFANRSTVPISFLFWFSGVARFSTCLLRATVGMVALKISQQAV
jgi:hypothetical protein